MGAGSYPNWRIVLDVVCDEFDVAGRLKAGVVWCNTFNQFDAASPFGGYKESGFGREGGMHGLRPYVRIG